MLKSSRIPLKGRTLVPWAVRTRHFHASRKTQFELISLVEPVHDAFQHLHTWSGLEWHALIPLTTILLRSTFTLPISILNRLRTRKQVELQPLLSGMGPILKARLASSKAAQQGLLTREQIEVLTVKEKRKQRIKLFKKFKCQTWKNLTLPLVQIPIWIEMSMVIRSMCGWSALKGIPSEPSFLSDSFWWYSDLIVSDPYYALPLAIGAVSMANIEWNVLSNLSPAARRERELKEVARSNPDSEKELTMAGQSGVSGPSIPVILTNMARGGTIIFITIAMQAPTALCLYWFSSNAYSLVQNILLDKYLPITDSPQPLQISADTMKLDDPR
ncbi:Cox18p [Sugiyamaella lignohabitans]|uniref:Cox18p n=1 Tax=Sugiyamaella lignohabitans TaxID=796027 RepID=A0A167F5Y0_9ASCO|nr:Cox18p [Sugiyamaella lignohabitans]ANB14874.1 Cox18p [Sugiyamaella lignohabitans]